MKGRRNALEEGRKEDQGRLKRRKEGNNKYMKREKERNELMKL